MSADSAAAIERFASDELDVVSVSRECFTKFYITAHPDRNGNPDSVFQRLADFVHDRKATIVTQDVFGDCKLYSAGMRQLERAWGRIDWPVTWIQGYGLRHESITGTQVYAVADATVEPVYVEGQIAGGLFEDNDAVYCLLGNVQPTDPAAANATQAREVFEKIEKALKKVGMEFSNVVRTWFYLNNILEWYAEFNQVRSDCFTEHGIFEALVPASTGIGAGNPQGAALVAEAFAVKPKNDNVKVFAVPSPLQCPATEYRSSFSRAVELQLSDHRRLYVSGTASIGADGKTLHIGDVQKQIECTMEVVQAILESRKMTWADTSRAIAYFKNIKDAPLLGKYLSRKALPRLPIAVAHGDICRDDLLFEIEVDAVTV